MPRLNSLGEVAMGVAGTQGSVNGQYIPDTLGPYWVTNDTVITLQPSTQSLIIYNIRNGQRTPVQQPFTSWAANDFRGGGGNWAAWANIIGVGLFSPSIHRPESGLQDVGPDGSVGYKPVYQGDRGSRVRELNGDDWVLTETDVVYELQLLGQRRAVWRNEFNVIKVSGIPQPVQIGAAYWPVAAFLNGEWWIAYFSTIAGLIVHPFSSTIGYRIAPVTLDAFNNTIVALGNNIKFAYSLTTGERPQDLVSNLIDTVNQPRTELRPSTGQIVPLNRPHWLGCFTGQPGVLGGWDTSDDPPAFQDVQTLPGNGYLDVPSSTFFGKPNKPVGSFIHSQPGWTVETMEAAALTSAFTPICYWDSRNWPRWPNLPANSWLCIQAYCGRNEPFSVFEAAIRAKLVELAQIKPSQLIAIVAQCYWQTPVNNLTDDLNALVPIFSRLAAEFPNVIATIPFNGNGRFNGMQQHPEVRPLWNQFAAGITGEPGMANPQLPSDVCEAVHRERNKYDAPPNDNDLAKILNDAAWSCGQGADIGVSRKAGGAHAESPERPGLGPIARDIIHRKSDNMIWDVLIAAGDGGPATPNCGEALGEMTDPNRPWVSPVQPPDVPDPDPISVTIYYNDPIARRSDPFGCNIKYEVNSAHPVTKAEFFCEGNGENPIVVEFPVGPGFDGRYIRQIGVKFTVNGLWTLKVRGHNNQGQVGESDGSHKVEVTF